MLKVRINKVGEDIHSYFLGLPLLQPTLSNSIHPFKNLFLHLYPFFSLSKEKSEKYNSAMDVCMHLSVYLPVYLSIYLVGSSSSSLKYEQE